MAVEVRIPTILRTYTAGSKAVSGCGDTVRDVLADLETRHAGLSARIIDEKGDLQRFVNVYVDDEDIRFTGSLSTAVKANSTVTILPAVAGG